MRSELCIDRHERRYWYLCLPCACIVSNILAYKINVRLRAGYQQRLIDGMLRHVRAYIPQGEVVLAFAVRYTEIV